MGAARSRDTIAAIPVCPDATDRPGVLGPLADPESFNRVRIELGVLTWPNDADLDPAWIHENVSQ